MSYILARKLITLQDSQAVTQVHDETDPNPGIILDSNKIAIGFNIKNAFNKNISYTMD